MQNQYFDPADRSGLDSIVNSDFIDHYNRSSDSRTKSGYLNPVANQDLTKSQSAASLAELLSSAPETYIDEPGYGRATSEPYKQHINTPTSQPKFQKNSAIALNSTAFSRTSPEVPITESLKNQTQPPLMIDVPTAIPLYSNNTISSGVEGGTSSENYRGSAGMSPEDQPFKNEKVKKAPTPSKRKWIWLTFSFILLIGICGVLALVTRLVYRKNDRNIISNQVDKPQLAEKLWGRGGDTITIDKANKFFYNNTLGGTWVAIPYNDTARPQADQPALDENWDYSVNRITGVNAGGWLVIEPFITPGLFDPFADNQNPPRDEWELCKTLGSSMAKTIEAHYDSFMVEEDFAQIASAGLNWVRIPVGWWMIETLGEEPFLAGVSWKYLLRAIVWARKYGLRINLDLHAAPGSQNGWNHSGKLGNVGFLSGAMGIANAQRTLNYIRILTQFISQPEYRRVIPMFSILNEPLTTSITNKALASWYYESYKLIRQIGGIGEGNGPFIVIHDGFQGISSGSTKNPWTGFLRGSDRIGLDSHTYFAFGSQLTDVDPLRPCSSWAASSNQTMEGFGLSMSGEWSLALNDCGLYVNGIGMGHRFEGTFPSASKPESGRIGSCDQWLDHRKWTDSQKKGFADMAQASQDALINSFFWTWKIGNSTRQDNPPNPMWNYKLGLEAGYIRPDARASIGRCTQLASEVKQPLTTYNWSGKLASWQTGAGAASISQAQIDAIGPFPPATILGGAPNGQGIYNTSSLAQLTPTGPIITLKAPPIIMNSKTYAGGDGWFNKQDTAGFFTTVNGCQYFDPWNGVNQPAPSPCNLSGSLRPHQLR